MTSSFMHAAFSHFEFSLQTGAMTILASVVFYLAMSWVTHLGRASEKALDSLSTAYLLAGRTRAREVAFFELVRDGYLHPGQDGFFNPRGSEVPESLHYLLRELLSEIQDRAGLSVKDLGKMNLEGLMRLDRSLTRRGFLLSSFDHAVYRTLATAPLFLCSVGLAWHGFIRAPDELASWLVLSGIATGCAFFTRRSFHRMTHAGRKRALAVVHEAKGRLANAHKPARDGNPSDYDLLWIANDEILLGGLASQKGGLFAASHPASFKKHG